MYGYCAKTGMYGCCAKAGTYAIAQRLVCTDIVQRQVCMVITQRLAYMIYLHGNLCRNEDKDMSTKGKILYAEDELGLSMAVSEILKMEGFEVTAVMDGLAADEVLQKEHFDIAILDIMMPGMDGIQVLTKLREKGIDSPVLLLTAKSDIDDRITGLDSGADDYLTKPFAMGELLARIRAMTRRRTEFAPSTLTFGNVSLNRQSFELSGPNGSQKLGNKEFQMIEALMLNHGTLISTERFMEKIWGYDSDAEINVVWVYISYLRKKLGLIGADVEIKATRGVGYTLEEKHND